MSHARMPPDGSKQSPHSWPLTSAADRRFTSVAEELTHDAHARGHPVVALLLDVARQAGIAGTRLVRRAGHHAAPVPPQADAVLDAVGAVLIGIRASIADH